MTYEQWLEKKIELNNAVDVASNQLNSFIKQSGQKTTFGLTPDHVKETKKYTELKRNFTEAANELRKFNGDVKSQEYSKRFFKAKRAMLTKKA